MMDSLKPHFWDKRFGGDEYIYGDQPNEYLKEKLSVLTPGTILFPCEGEGRNSVYAASIGWKVDAFDMSSSGQRKAFQLAEKSGVKIDYKISTVEDFETDKKYDLLVLIYAHFPEEQRRMFHQKLASFIKPEGHLILEAFSKEHIKFQQENPNAGGPRVESMLYNLDEIKNDFKDFDFLEAKEVKIILNEGNYHKGNAEVIRVFGIKN